MSAKEREREQIVVPYEDHADLLESLNFTKLLQDCRRQKILAAKYDAAEKVTRAAIAACIKVTGADTVVYTDSNGREWLATYVPEGPNPTLNKEKLQMNMGKIGKLDAETVKAIIEASTDKGSRSGYGKVTLPKEPKGK